jgi:hypothetical protein
VAVRADARGSIVTATLAWVAVTVAGASACGSRCDTVISLQPVTVQGSPAADLDLSARITAGGRPVPDVRLEFKAGWPPDGGIAFGTATTDADGVAHLHVDDAVGIQSILGKNATTWTKYQAEVSAFQTSQTATQAICIRSGQSSFRYEP